MPKVLKYAIAFTHTLTVCFVNIVSENCVSAQINPDETLGSERSSLAPNVGIRQGVRGDRIDGEQYEVAIFFIVFKNLILTKGKEFILTIPQELQTLLLESQALNSQTF